MLTSLCASALILPVTLVFVIFTLALFVLPLAFTFAFPPIVLLFTVTAPPTTDSKFTSP